MVIRAQNALCQPKKDKKGMNALPQIQIIKFKSIWREYKNLRARAPSVLDDYFYFKWHGALSRKPKL